MTTGTDGRRYRFGPLERRGLIAGWRGGQIASVAGGVVVGVLALRLHPTVSSVMAAAVAVAGGVALAWWPVGGRTGEEWLPTVARWGASGLAGRRRCTVGVSGAGALAGAGGADGAAPARDGCRPRGGAPVRGQRLGHGVFAPLELLSVTPGAGGGSGVDGASPVGVVFDRRRHTFTAVLELRGHSFALLGARDKDRRVASWSALLASLARERSVVHRLQWLASTVPDDGAAVRAYLDDRAALDADTSAHRSYAALLQASGTATCRHDVFLAVQVQALGMGARAVRAAGGGSAGAAAVLLHELAALRRHLMDADVPVERMLDPPALATLIRRAGEPSPMAAIAPHPPAPLGAPSASAGGGWPWPMGIEEEWSCVRTDGAWHAAYWIAEWPRVDVGPDFLGPLLLGSMRRTVAVVMEPVSPSRAIRQAEQARTADLADAELRRRGGFLSTARRAREAEVAGRREEELADGHSSFRFAGFVTVTAPSRELLGPACEATEQAAGQCRLELRRLYGDQVHGFATSLPLGFGLP